jgi:ATP-dependent DNA helicase RecG
MTGRPEALYPLFADLTSLPGIGAKTARAFAGLRVEAPRDLLYTLPHAVVERRPVASVREVAPPVVVTVAVDVIGHVPAARKGRPHVVTVRDAGTTFQLVYFHAAADWLKRLLPLRERRIVSGRLDHYDGIARIVHPDHVVAPDEADAIPEVEAVYPLAQGLTQKGVTRAVDHVLATLPDLVEWIDPALLAERGWPSWADALRAAHRPGSAAQCGPDAAARQRLAYDEFLAHQTTLALVRGRRRHAPGRETAGDGTLRARALQHLPYAPTSAQTRAIEEIAADLAEPCRMHRLLQGDVGAGKTLVAFMAMLTAVEAGGQAALMAPTEILARQHGERLAADAAYLGLRLDVLTGRDGAAGRRETLRALAEGRTDIAVGTHALFQDDVAFADLRLAVVDEQHRFGVAERMRLGAKGDGVDVLVMTATPIPRSLALTHYGDMDVSVLDEKPPGRQPIRTATIPMSRLGEVIEHLREAVAGGQRAYWVCPLVEDSEASDLTAASERFAHLRAAFGETVRLVHGQMPGPDRDAAMRDFASGAASVLVATTVIEVGVDVPEAVIMVIERAEWFGLAQLHQLRGRVGRGTGRSSCLLLYQPPLTEAGRRRLDILRQTEDGFCIAEEDLAMRGAGDLLGTAQSGLPRFYVADAERQGALLVTAQRDARRLVADDPDLSGPRGRAMRLLLWLMRQDQAVDYLRAG